VMNQPKNYYGARLKEHGGRLAYELSLLDPAFHRWTTNETISPVSHQPDVLGTSAHVSSAA
jgi:hypothetical protein